MLNVTPPVLFKVLCANMTSALTDHSEGVISVKRCSKRVLWCEALLLTQAWVCWIDLHNSAVSLNGHKETVNLLFNAYRKDEVLSVGPDDLPLASDQLWPLQRRPVPWRCPAEEGSLLGRLGRSAAGPSLHLGRAQGNNASIHFLSPLYRAPRLTRVL